MSSHYYLSFSRNQTGTSEIQCIELKLLNSLSNYYSGSWWKNIDPNQIN